MKKSTTFTKEMEIKLNGLAVAMQSGNIEAKDELFSIMFPVLQGYAKRFHNPHIEQEDLVNDFVISTFKAVDNFKNEGKNVSGLIFTTCKNDFLKSIEKFGAEKRSKYKDSMVHLDKEVGDGGITLNEVVTSEEKSIELLAEEHEQAEAMAQMISEFLQVSKGRHGKVMAIVYKAQVEGWETEEEHEAIYNMILQDEGKELNNQAVRKAKSRAIEKLRDAMESGQVGLASQV